MLNVQNFFHFSKFALPHLFVKVKGNKRREELDFLPSPFKISQKSRSFELYFFFKLAIFYLLYVSSSCLFSLNSLKSFSDYATVPNSPNSQAMLSINI